MFYFHTSFTRNGDDVILLIKKDNAYNERMFSQAIINTFKMREGIETQSKMMVAAK